MSQANGPYDDEYSFDEDMTGQELYTLVDAESNEYMSVGITLGVLQEKAHERQAIAIRHVVNRARLRLLQAAVWGLRDNCAANLETKLATGLWGLTANMKSKGLRRVLARWNTREVHLAVSRFRQRWVSETASRRNQAVALQAIQRVMKRWMYSARSQAIGRFRRNFQADQPEPEIPPEVFTLYDVEAGDVEITLEQLQQKANERRAKALWRVYSRWEYSAVARLALTTLKLHRTEDRLLQSRTVRGELYQQCLAQQAAALRRLVRRAASSACKDAISSWRPKPLLGKLQHGHQELRQLQEVLFMHHTCGDKVLQAHRTKGLFHMVRRMAMRDVQTAVWAMKQSYILYRLANDTRARKCRRAMMRLQGTALFDAVLQWKQKFSVFKSHRAQQIRALRRTTCRWTASQMQAVFLQLKDSWTAAAALNAHRRYTMQRALARVLASVIQRAVQRMLWSFKRNYSEATLATRRQQAKEHMRSMVHLI